MIKIPTFESFKKYERQVYAYISVFVAMSLFYSLKLNYENQIKECAEERIELNNKIETLYNKLLKINENINVNPARDSIHK
jgi:hypothetical protein